MYSAQLIPKLSELLRRRGLEKTAIGAFAVVSGPGSFTGLRVGLSTVKGLAEVGGQPIAAVSSLEAVAFAAHDDGRVIAALDAGRGQVFLGEYQVGGGGLLREREWIATLEKLLAARRESAEIPLVTPDELIVRALQFHGLAAHALSAPQADVVARVGLGKILRRETISPEALDANYIRRSDAELFSLPKLS
jgi:tRNA threonylcarbamoyladenosine biosynthesis protein TsaB